MKHYSLKLAVSYMLWFGHRDELGLFFTLGLAFMIWSDELVELTHFLTEGLITKLKRWNLRRKYKK